MCVCKTIWYSYKYTDYFWIICVTFQIAPGISNQSHRANTTSSSTRSSERPKSGRWKTCPQRGRPEGQRLTQWGPQRKSHCAPHGPTALLGTECCQRGKESLIIPSYLSVFTFLGTILLFFVEIPFIYRPSVQAGIVSFNCDWVSHTYYLISFLSTFFQS